MARLDDQYPTKGSRPTFTEYRHWLERRGRMTPAVEEAISFATIVAAKKEPICYVAGALTEATDEDKHRYVKTSRLCKHFGIFGYAPHVYGTDPKKHSNVTPDEVRDIDFLWAVVLACFQINFLSPIAHGNAIEEGWAEYAHIPTIYCTPETMRISRLTRGMLNTDSVISYKNISGCYRKLRGLFQEIQAWRANNPQDDTRFFAERAKNIPTIFTPTRKTEDFLVLVADTAHHRYGQMGAIHSYDWREGGYYYVSFGDGAIEALPDGMCGNLRPFVLIDKTSILERFRRGDSGFDGCIY